MDFWCHGIIVLGIISYIAPLETFFFVALKQFNKKPTCKKIKIKILLN